MKLKRQILDALDKAHDFALPETLVGSEFEGIWKQVTQGLKQAGKTFADEGRNEEEMKAEYRKIAERRVRLGLVIAEIGDKNGIKVTDDEVSRAVVDKARQFPGQEQQVRGATAGDDDAITDAPGPDETSLAHALRSQRTGTGPPDCGSCPCCSH